VTPRVALLADTFHEVNGAARTCRELAAFAGRRGYPFLTVCYSKTAAPAGARDTGLIELRRSRLAIRLDSDLSFDPLFCGQLARVERALREFQPDLIHITSPGDAGILGAILAHRLRLPLAASWHTNLHEFAGRRVESLLGWAPRTMRAGTAARVERFVLDRVLWFFSRAEVAFAPNPELISLVACRSGRSVFPMLRGVDTRLFSPTRRKRSDKGLVLGYVGRLMPEKRVKFLAELERFLVRAGARDFRFLIVGSGSERSGLEKTMERAEFTGVLRGEALATAYADMDVFVFPSETDTFGNVVQEALASGVPAVVTDKGGPRFIVADAVDGFIAADDAGFCAAVERLIRDGPLRRTMAEAAVRQMESRSWDLVFDQVYEGYAAALRDRPPAAREPSSEPGRTVGSVLWRLLSRPQDTFVRGWNWKSAVLSSLFRCSIFFMVNLGAGLDRALGAVLTELVFRAVTAGWWGSITQAFRRVRPMWKAVAVIAPLLLLLQHSMELLVHWLRGTPRLVASIAGSIAFTIVSTAAQLALMRTGALIVGPEAKPLREDLASLPRLIWSVLKTAGQSLKRAAWAAWQQEAERP
jgi:glycosyltransferase involved in cell wall biosynthesis